MLLSVYPGSFGGDLRDALAAAGAAGFEAVELRHAVDGVPLTTIAPEAFSTVCDLAAEHGLVVATLALGQVAQHAGDPDGLRRVAELSALTGARIRLHSSTRPGGDRFEEPPEMLYQHELAALRTCLETIQAVNPQALVMIEPSAASVCNTIERLSLLLADVDRPQVGINWDFVNAWRAGEHPWPDPWRHLRGRLYGVHWKGAKADAHDPWRYSCHALPGDDDIPHRSMWSTWAATGFDGPVTVDPEYHLFGPREKLSPEPANPEWELCCEMVKLMADYRRRGWERLG
jgi:sugar phosphate isomerase/epimerase